MQQENINLIKRELQKSNWQVELSEETDNHGGNEENNESCDGKDLSFESMFDLDKAKDLIQGFSHARGAGQNQTVSENREEDHKNDDKNLEK